MVSPSVIYNAIFLPVILLIGIATSLQDFKYARIKNALIFFGLGFSACVYIFLAALRLLQHYGVALFWVNSFTNALFFNFDKWSINFIISVIVAFILWRLQMWGAGDAKLFICYAALIPLGRYSKVYFDGYFCSFLLLSAIFIPATIYIAIQAVCNLFKNLNRREINSHLAEFKANKKTNMKILLGFFVLYLFFAVLRAGFRGIAQNGFFSNNYSSFVFSFFGFRLLVRIFSKNTMWLIFMAVAIVVYALLRISLSPVEFFMEIRSAFLMAVLMIVLMPLFRHIFAYYEFRALQKTTPFAHWMFLGALITWYI
jgi:hypothetical protein